MGTQAVDPLISGEPSEPVPPSEGLAVLQAGPSPVAPRLLAAFVDYLVVSALVLSIGSQLPIVDYYFLLPFVFGGLYFTLGHSEFIGGWTLGKRAFGLRVVDTRSTTPKLGLSISQSALRYFATYGVVILLSEIPLLLYRAIEFRSSNYVVELHMLVVFGYTLSNFAAILFFKDRVAGHDCLTGSQVVRLLNEQQDSEQPAASNSPTLVRQWWRPLAFGSICASALWLLGVLHTPAVSEISGAKYALENQFAVRVISLQQFGTRLEFSALSLTSDENPQFSALAKGIGVYLVEEGILRADDVEIVEFSFIAPQMQMDRATAREPIRIAFDVHSAKLK